MQGRTNEQAPRRVSGQREVVNMPKKTPAPDQKSTISAKALIPPQVSYLIEDKPVLWYENPNDYDRLMASVFAELDPKGAIETILVKDVVDYIWEARRMRRLKAAAIHAETPDALVKLSDKKSEFGLSFADHSKKGQIIDIARAGTVGFEEDAEQLQIHLASLNLSPDIVTYEAYKLGMKTIHAINSELERLERRRDQTLKSILERRSTLHAMAKSLILREEAENVSVMAPEFSA
jgi:hypothetical protein